MLIGIDASRALKKQRTGTEVHNAEIIKHLVKVDQVNTYRLYSSIPPYGDLLDLGKNVEWRVMPFVRGWSLFRLSIEMLTNQPDVLFIPAHILPLIPAKKSVVMIHDIGFDHFPDLYKWTDIAYHRYAVRFAKRFAAHILTPTEFTRQDLHSKYKIPLSKITTVYHGFDASSYRPKEKGESSPVDEPYFYFVGRLEYKKNISRMLEGFGQFKEATRLPHRFLLSGRDAYGIEDIKKTYESLGQWKKDVTFLGFTSQEDSVRYLRHAEALVFPTLFEGFGLPVLEAFASNTPVITSNTSCLPEIAGDAALLVTPTDVTAIAKAMTKIAQNPELRHELIHRGGIQFKKFSWDKAAKETLAVLEKAGSHA